MIQSSQNDKVSPPIQWGAVKCVVTPHPECGGEDRRCLVAEARGEHCRCEGMCAYAVYQPVTP